MNRTFNSMLEHLVHGQFDVDPNIIDEEGFLRSGHVYSYFGVTGAFVRLPLLLFHRLDLDVTVWSCLLAICLAGMMRVRTVLFLRRHAGSPPGSELAFALMLTYIVLGGAAVGYLKSSTFQEAVFWAFAFAEFFVYFAVKGLVSGRFSVATLSWMGLAAGLAMLTRVSTGIGLCVAFGLLLLVLLAEEIHSPQGFTPRQFLGPLAVLVALLIVTGVINYFRWGNPATFADTNLYLYYHDHPDQMLRMRLYGDFNLSRVLFGVGYYFLPIWTVRGADGQLLFLETQTRLMNGAELPPGSFFLTDLLPIVFIFLLAVALWSASPEVGIGPGDDRLRWLRIVPLPQALALALGLAVPCVLMLAAIYMSYRYRMEFYPLIDFLAFLGLYATVSNPTLLARFNRHRRWMLVATAISIVSAFVALVLYWLSNFGPSENYLRHGLVHYYLQNAYNHWKNSRLALFLYH
jgi:hypothetical protein